ncbi:MAG: magnesium chelatase ATPase subunit I [Pyrinomonadaceae bacterium]
MKSNSKQDRAVYPFTAIVGQEEMKLALLLNVIDPLIGGVLIMGHRGTAKSTAVRALADLLPEIRIVAGCLYRCDPLDEENLCSNCRQTIKSGSKLKSERALVNVVDLPLGATEDRICGTIAIEQALKSGTKAFEPGLLARANRGFLYIDEVNLLDDHLVDVLLDVAATGRNKVERESISVEHPAAFVLIGSGNPEEGELRPQLVDRFGLHVEIKTEDDVDERLSIIQRRDAFDRDPEPFCASFAGEQKLLRLKLQRGRKLLGRVTVPESALRQIVGICSELKIDGHRGELTMMRAARAVAALEGRMKVSPKDVQRISAMSLRHRLRREALDESGTTEQINEVANDIIESSDAIGRKAKERAQKHHESANGSRFSGATANASTSTDSVPAQASKTRMKDFDGQLNRSLRRDRGKLSAKPSRGSQNRFANYSHGRYAHAIQRKFAMARIAVDATLRALIFSQPTTGAERPAPDGLLPVPANALRFKQLQQKQGTLFIFAIDTSGSMAAHRIVRAKRAMFNLLQRSYVNRDTVAIVSFRERSATVEMSPSRSMLSARRVLESLSMGGSTPIAAGLVSVLDLMRRFKARSHKVVLLIFTDGHANVPLKPDRGDCSEQVMDEQLVQLGMKLRKQNADIAVIDSQPAFLGDDGAKRLARILEAQYIKVQFAGRPIEEETTPAGKPFV